jgi:Rod binding domain-containing protein
MTALSSTSLSSIDPSLLPASTPAIDQSQLPASIRNGTPAAKQAYQTALGFEQILVNELTQEMASTVTNPDDGSSTDGSSDDSSGADGTSGLLGSDAASSVYSQMMPDALTSSIMSSGGTGIALELAKALDPSIGAQPLASAPTTTQPSGGASIAAQPPAGAPTTTQPSGGASIAAQSLASAATGTQQPAGTSTGTPSIEAED